MVIDEKLKDNITEVLLLRHQLRNAKEYDKADIIRSKLEALGIILDDTINGTYWKVILHGR